MYGRNSSVKKVHFSLLVRKNWPDPQLAFTRHVRISVEYGKPINHRGSNIHCTPQSPIFMCIRFVGLLDPHVMSILLLTILSYLEIQLCKD